MKKKPYLLGKISWKHSWNQDCGLKVKDVGTEYHWIDRKVPEGDGGNESDIHVDLEAKKAVDTCA